ncbi:hypothetical protein, conserved [Babesia bigemina]|uniref:C3H1-type domain-containing protein n=1 Tax=Babesia bigemina TaxID=5866 RepID=A0A061BT23_BABBI|nr:hypothetical protein, conserved [Babesia bigemina]CDR71653.1 hypothetical protein, conserved [Babesia bigemina]|eukprot:XP_012770600.1 hypothetical protein, conserved [Babesia bigemina]
MIHSDTLYGTQIHLREMYKEINTNIIGDARSYNSDTVPSNLTQIMVFANMFNSTAIPNRINECISDITAKVKYEVTEKIKTLKKSALSQFVTRKTAELEELKKFVHYQKNIISKTIFTNQTTGLKGLMNTIGSNLQSYIDPLRYPSVKDLSKHLDFYFNPLFTHISTEASPSSQLVAGLQARTYDLLTHLHDNNRTFTFDAEFRSHLHELTSALSTFDPADFANPHHPQLLDALKAGMQGLVAEMEKAYVSRYDGHPKMEWKVIKEKKVTDELTVDATRCAKVFMSCLPMWVEDLGELKRRCEHSWQGKAIHLKDEIDKENPLGEFLKHCGYIVPTSQKSHQDGELQCKYKFTGANILEKLVENKLERGTVFDHIKACESNQDIKTGKPKEKTHFDISNILDCLYHHLDQYNEVGHLSTLTSKRHPCSVYDMLVWLSGLTHNPVRHVKLDAAITHILEELYKRGKEDVDEVVDGLEIEPVVGDNFKISLVNNQTVPLEAYPRNVSYEDMRTAVTDICANAYDVLTTIAGTGDEFTTYASDLSNNSMKFHYPQSGEDCFDMLLDILRRLFPPLKFLLGQCSYAAYNFGWRDCMYGKDIASGKSQCIDHSEDKAACQPNGKPNDQPKCQVNSQANCRPTSPLMSYLNDCLPGHLPHQLSKIGCRYECLNCPSTSKKGMPCLTPLGFRGFSGSTKTGGDICHIIRKFFANTHLNGLLCLIPKPPSTLPEHFSFVQSLANSCGSSKRMNLSDMRSAFEASVNNLSIQLQTDSTVFTKALVDAYGSKSATHTDCEHPHLTTLTTTDTCKGKKKNVNCAPYIYPLAEDAYCYFAMKHCDTYVSWAVYLPWTFWEYLKNLCDDFCNIFCADWGCRSCLNSSKCKRGEHGKSDEPKENVPGQPHCKCSSMVKCKGVSPTFYRYGFAFGDPNALDANKQCHDFYNQLTAVLKSQYFKNLFDTCDHFLFKIRSPFIWLNVALWLLSLLYLLHIMVIRLDLLHIKSHLHSPSSHRIAAQSLLAAARVNKLGRVFYLQP